MAMLTGIVVEQECDYGQLDDDGEWSATVVGGPHNGHRVTVYEEKHNCGACSVAVSCSCGASWQSRMDGCWQYGHQRPEQGNADLAGIARATPA